MSFTKSSGIDTISLHYTEDPVYDEETVESTTKVNLFGLTGTDSTDSNNKTITTYNTLPTASPNRTPEENKPNIHIEFFKPAEYSHIKH
jgi:hypothetical protein